MDISCNHFEGMHVSIAAGGGHPSSTGGAVPLYLSHRYIFEVFHVIFLFFPGMIHVISFSIGVFSCGIIDVFLSPRL